MKLTLGMVRSSRIPKALNVCADSTDLVSYVNEASSRLLSLPDEFWGTWQQARFNLCDGFVAWPRGVVSIREAKICGTPMVLRNQWYDYVGPVGQPCASSVNGSFLVLQDDGTTPVAAQVSGTGNYVRIYPVSSQDIGKRILVQGYDMNGVWVRTEDESVTPSIWVDGEWITIASPFGQSETQWLKNGITGIQREATVQRTPLFEVDFTTTLENQLADYQPDELVPDYRRSKILNFRNVFQQYTQMNCACKLQIECVVKLEHIPVVQDTDYFVIGNLPALKEAATSVKLSEDGLQEEGNAAFARAVTLLRQELTNYNGRQVHILPQLHGGRTFFNGVMAGMR